MTPPLEGFDEGFDPGVAQRLKKSGGLSVCQFSCQRSSKASRAERRKSAVLAL
jgi:hypothetical protein